MNFKLIEYCIGYNDETKYKIYKDNSPTYGYTLQQINYLLNDTNYNRTNNDPLHDSLYCNVKILLECSTREEINQYLLDKFAEEIL